MSSSSKKPQPRSNARRIVPIHLSAEAHAELLQAAQAEGLALSTWLRITALRAARALTEAV